MSMLVQKSLALVVLHVAIVHIASDNYVIAETKRPYNEGQSDFTPTCCTDGGHEEEDESSLLQVKLTSNSSEPKEGPQLKQLLSTASGALPQTAISDILHNLHLALLQTVHRTASLSGAKVFTLEHSHSSWYRLLRGSARGSVLLAILLFLVLPLLLFALCLMAGSSGNAEGNLEKVRVRKAEPHPAARNESRPSNSLFPYSRETLPMRPSPSVSPRFPSPGTYRRPPSSPSPEPPPRAFVERVAALRSPPNPDLLLPNSLLQDPDMRPISNSFTIPNGAVCTFVVPKVLERTKQYLSLTVGSEGGPVFRIDVDEIGVRPGMSVKKFHGEDEIAFLSTECLWPPVGLVLMQSYRKQREPHALQNQNPPLSIFRPGGEFYCSMVQNANGGFSVLHTEGELLDLSGDFNNHVILIKSHAGRDLAFTSQLSPYEYEVKIHAGADPVLVLLALLAVDKLGGTAGYKTLTAANLAGL